MFSHNLYEALCQTETRDNTPVHSQEEDAGMLAAIQRALDTYQRVYSQRSTASEF